MYSHTVSYIGSVQDPYVTYIYILFLPAPHPFPLAFVLAYFSFLSYVHPYVLSIWRAIS
jgi:hypothetical protein